MRTRILLCALIALATSARAQTIGLYSDPQGTNCALQVPLQTSATLYVVYKPGPAVDAFAFDVQGTLPAGNGYQVISSTPNPSSSFINGTDPFAGPTIIGFQPCLPPTSPAVLYTIVLQNVSDAIGGKSIPMSGLLRECANPLATISLVGVTAAMNPPVSPTVATYVSPANGATGVDPGYVTFVWNGLTIQSPCVPYRISHQLHVGTNPNELLLQGDSRDHSADGSQRIQRPTDETHVFLQPERTYYWRIDTIRNIPLEVVTGPVWSFTTTSLPPPPCLTSCVTETGCPPACFRGISPDPDQCGLTPQGELFLRANCPSPIVGYEPGRYDLTLGFVETEVASCPPEGTNYAEMIAADRFHVVGPVTSQAIAFNARLGCTTSGTGWIHEGLASPTFGLDNGSGVIVLPLLHSVGEEFLLLYAVGGQSGTLSRCDLTFNDLPPGYTVESCSGYRSTVHVEPATWSRLKTLYR